MENDKYAIYYCENENLKEEFYTKITQHIGGHLYLKIYVHLKRQLKYCIDKNDVIELLKKETTIDNSLEESFSWFESNHIDYTIGIKDGLPIFEVDNFFILYELGSFGRGSGHFVFDKANLDVNYNNERNYKIKTKNNEDFIRLYLEQNDERIREFSKYLYIDYLLKNIEQIIQTKSIFTLENYSIKDVNSNKSLKWHGSKIDLIELSKALVENGTLKGTQKDIIDSLGAFFDIDTTNQDKTINDMKKRNNGSETKFLNSLKSSLYNFISKENIR